jgi:hypothetical protein
MSRLQKLLDKIKNASGPSRELDAEIASVIGWKVYNYAISGPHVDLPEAYDLVNAAQVPCPKWTESLDACDKLFRFMFPGYRRSLHNIAYLNGVYQGDGKEQAIIYHPLSSGGEPKFVGVAANGALAYLAAILTALIDLENKDK